MAAFVYIPESYRCTLQKALRAQVEVGLGGSSFMLQRPLPTG